MKLLQIIDRLLTPMFWIHCRVPLYFIIFLLGVPLYAYFDLIFIGRHSYFEYLFLCAVEVFLIYLGYFIAYSEQEYRTWRVREKVLNKKGERNVHNKTDDRQVL